MQKYEFLYKLRSALSNLPKEERDEIVHYYEELIQDAIDNGEEETAFIEKLGSIDKIARTIKTNENFVTNVKEKRNFELNYVFSSTVKIIGYIIYAFLVFIIVSIEIGVIGWGINSSLSGIISLYYDFRNQLPVSSYAHSIGLITLGAGLIMIGISLLMLIGRKSKEKLERLLEKIDKIIKKGEK